jgi:hypothetical protein
MALKLTLEDLDVESFSPAATEAGTASWSDSHNVTLYGCTCGCGTYDGCPSDGPNCTLPCVEPSGATDWQACCG